MAGSKCLQGLTFLFSFGAFCWASPLVADQAQPAPAGTPATSAPLVAQITDVKFLELSRAPAEPPIPGSEAKLTSVLSKVKFRIAILGENLPCTATTRDVILQTQDPGQPVEHQIVTCPKQGQVINVYGEAPVGTVITSVTVMTGGCKETLAAAGEDAIPGAAAAKAAPNDGRCTPPAKTNTNRSKCNAAVSTNLTISIRPIPPESVLRDFGIQFTHQQSKEFPNLHSLLVTKQSGDAKVGFAANPNHMRVDLEPTGTSDLRVTQSNEEQMELHFVAAADYVPTNVVITVYNNSDLDTRIPWFVGKVAAASKPPATDPNAPTITSVETVFLDRHEGNGRVRIYGKGFGKHFALPPYPVDDFLCDCLERRPQALPNWERFRTCGTLSTELEKDQPSPYKESDTPKLKEAIAKLEADRLTYCTNASVEENRLAVWMKWQCSVANVGIIVGVNSRNPDIRVEKTEIININDEMIDVYFEFTRHRTYAWPFRLAGVDLTIPGTAKKVEQVVTSPTAKATGEVDAATPTTVHLFSAIGPKPDENLTYRYTVLSYREVQQLLGDGVADNFNVVELAVVNDGATKVAVPLAGMQAEIEWLYGRDVPGGWFQWLFGRDVQGGWFLEGPATLPPVPMATVSAYFGASKKKTERRVHVFNALEGITTLVGALIPFAGVGLKDAEVVFSSGFIPGLQHVWVDISDQQLQNLTTLSWQTSETLAANGGSMQKLIYIQRGEQFKSDKQHTANPPKVTLQQMADIMGLEITGYEIPDSAAKLATPAGKSPTTGTKKTTSTTSKPASDSTDTTTVTTTSETTSPP